MQLTKKIVYLFICLLFGVGAAQAQKQVNAEQRANAHANSLIKKLSLNDTQAPQVREILKQFYEKMSAAQQMEKGPDKRQALDNARTERNDALRKVLTTEQWNLWQQQKQENREKAEAKRAAKGKGKKKSDNDD